jgi:putative SOS response-associated peptidase YedK
MCGRFTLSTPAAAVASFFDLSDVPACLAPRYNIAPTQAVAVVRYGAGGRTLALVRWGLIPPWAKDAKIGNSLINARGETVAAKPAFRSAFRRRRCLLPADGFLEWAKAGPRKQPYHFRRPDAGPFALAGLWERWQPPGGAEPVETCTVLTTAANELVAPFHDRMPVILAPADFARWLDPGYDRAEGLKPLLKPYPAEALVAVAVNPLVNSPKNDRPECLHPAA